MTSPWLDATPPPDVRLLTDAELIALWHAHRQGPLGYCAADECARRLEARENGKRERGEQCGDSNH